MKVVFLDTETTGLNAHQGDRVLEIGCIEIVNRRPTGRRLHHYLNPQRASHPDALRVHGLTEQFLADKPLFATIADELLAFCDGAEVVIHNAGFDLGFLDAEFERLGRGAFRPLLAKVSDSLLMARNLYPGKSNSLDALCKRLEVDNSGRDLHGALLDAGLLAEVWLGMTRGQDSLVIDGSGPGGGANDAPPVDLRSFELPVLQATVEELAAHAAMLIHIDQASGGRTLWRLEHAA